MLKLENVSELSKDILIMLILLNFQINSDLEIKNDFYLFLYTIKFNFKIIK
jgi:hypothetical protein